MAGCKTVVDLTSLGYRLIRGDVAEGVIGRTCNIPPVVSKEVAQFPEQEDTAARENHRLPKFRGGPGRTIFYNALIVLQRLKTNIILPGVD